MGRLTETVSIITTLGVLGTLVLGFMNWSSLKKSGRQSREHSLKMADYEKIRDFLLIQISEYISLLDAHKLSYMALSDKEYKGKDMETYSHYFKLETCFYRIKLFLNSDNSYFNELSSILDMSLKTARKLQSANSFAEMLSHGLRHPKEYAAAYSRALNELERSEKTESHTIVIDNDADKENTLKFVEEVVKMRDEHLKKYLSATEESLKHKKMIVDIARKYLTCEKKQVTGG
ncbi:MAG: hypothetical protein BWY15_02194 [Firmicutes bacterium ADurb.Bin193]|nr:MAG: hypothetical protein BWY15_02194 [Firmicutes bacterium ADurb.Bin193]